MKGLFSIVIALSFVGTLCAERLCGVERLTRFDRLPGLLEGTRAMQVSTHDRSGENSDGWYGTYSYLYQDENGESVFKLSREDNGFNFFAYSNRTYQVWFCTNLMEGAWQNVTNFQGSEAIYSMDLTDAPKGFYRAEVQK